jgi:hypothetical protein
MKKSILTIGLFSLVMVLTSFTTETNNVISLEEILQVEMKLDIIGNAAAET